MLKVGLHGKGNEEVVVGVLVFLPECSGSPRKSLTNVSVLCSKCAGSQSQVGVCMCSLWRVTRTWDINWQPVELHSFHAYDTPTLTRTHTRPSIDWVDTFFIYTYYIYITLIRFEAW